MDGGLLVQEYPANTRKSWAYDYLEGIWMTDKHC
jgi:hypothetical protein